MSRIKLNLFKSSAAGKIRLLLFPPSPEKVVNTEEIELLFFYIQMLF